MHRHLTLHIIKKMNFIYQIRAISKVISTMKLHRNCIGICNTKYSNFKLCAISLRDSDVASNLVVNVPIHYVWFKKVQGKQNQCRKEMTLYSAFTGCVEKKYTIVLYILFRVVWKPQSRVIRRWNGNFVSFQNMYNF